MSYKTLNTTTGCLEDLTLNHFMSRKCPVTKQECCIAGNCDDCPSYLDKSCKECIVNMKPKTKDK